jgi:hypothetical protein
VEIFVLSNGTVSGTYRNITDMETGFIPVSFNVDPAFVLEMRSLFNGAASSACTPRINVGYGEVGQPLTVKRFCPPPYGLEFSADAKFWDMCVSLCDMCLPK